MKPFIYIFLFYSSCFSLLKAQADFISFDLEKKMAEIDLPQDTFSFRVHALNSNRVIKATVWKENNNIIQSYIDTVLHLTNLKAGKHIYVFTATNTKNYSVSDSVKLIVYPQPIINTSSDTNLVDPTSDFVLKIKGSGYSDMSSIKSYSWSQISGPKKFTFSGETTSNFSISGLDSGKYVFKFTVTNARGKSVSKNVSVIVTKKEKPVEPPQVAGIKPRKIFAINKEDFWEIENIENFPDYKVLIINEAGQKVFNSTFYHSNPWTGQLSGTRISEGAYFYIIIDKLNNEVLKGSLLVIR